MIDFASGSIVAGRYRLTEMFTGGEIVNVWKGLDTRANDEPVVLKIYSDEKKLHPFVVQFLKTEFAQTRTWKHPHLLHAKLFDFFNSIPYIVMPFLKKGALREQLASRSNGNRMTETEIVDLVRQIAGAISYLHLHNLVHQDICPGNILIGDGGEYLLSDFGLSRILYNTIVESEGAPPILHPAYAAPQLFEGQTANLADDIFSFGVMLFELTECGLPWGESGGKALLAPGAHVPVIKAPYSSALRLVIYKCLQRTPEDRPTAAQLVQWAKTYDPQQIAASESLQLEELRRTVEVSRQKTDSETKRREELKAAKKKLDQSTEPDFGTGDATRLRLEEESRDKERKKAAKEEMRLRLVEEERQRSSEEEKRIQQQTSRAAKEQDTRRQIEEEVRRKTETDVRRKVEEEARMKREEETRRRQEDEARRKEEEERRRKAEEETRSKRDSETRMRIETEVRQKLEAEARQRAEADARRRQEEESRRAADEDVRRKAEELRRKTEEETRRKVEETARRKAEEEARRRMEEEAKRKAREEDLLRKEQEMQKRAEETLRQAQEEARRIAEEETRKLAEEKSRRAAEDEERRKREEQSRREAEEEAVRKREELLRAKEREADRKANETLRKAQEEARRIAEEERKRIAEEQERRKAEEESRRRRDEENSRKREELLREKERNAEQKAEETLRMAQEAARRIAEEEARRVAEENARKVAEEATQRKAETNAQAEESLRKAEEEARRIAGEQATRVAEEQARRVAEEESRRHADEALKKIEEEVKSRVEQEFRAKQEVDAARRAEEEADRRRRLEEEKKRREAEEERRKADQAALRRMEADLRKKLDEELRNREEAGKRLKEEEDARRKAEEEARKSAEEETRRQAIEEARRKAAEEAKKRLEDSLNKIEDAVRRRLEEVLLTKSQEESQRKAEEEARRDEERIRLEIELDARKREQDRLRTESEERQRQIEEETRRRLEHEYEMRSLDEARRRAEDEVRREAERELKEKMELELRASREEEMRHEAEYERRRASVEFERSSLIQQSLNDLLQNVNLNAVAEDEPLPAEASSTSAAGAVDPFAPPPRARRASAYDPESAAPRLAPRDLPKPLPSRRKKLIGRLSALAVFGIALYFYLRPSIGEAVPETVLMLRVPSTIDQTLVPDLFTSFLNGKKANGMKAESPAEGNVRVSAFLPGVDKPVRLEVAPSGTGSGFESLADSRNDALITFRRLGRDEREQIQRMGAIVSFNDEQVVGLSGLAVIVHPDNPLKSIETETVGEMLSGEITSWKRRRGAADEIRLYLPLQTQDDYFNVESLLGSVNPARARVIYKPADSIAAATLADPQALGIVDRRYAAPAKILSVLSGGSEARFPVTEEISQENYPLSTRLYLYATDRVKNRIAREFLSFVQSDEGQAIVKRHGFVDQTVASLPRSLPPGAGEDYDVNTRGARKLSFQLRNHVGSTAFDAKAQQDILRLKAFLDEPPNHSKDLLILGFSNQLGNASSEELVASTMVKKAVEKMREQGITPALMRGLGAVSLVSEDMTEEGKARNRRVELWIR